MPSSFCLIDFVCHVFHRFLFVASLPCVFWDFCYWVSISFFVYQRHLLWLGEQRKTLVGASVPGLPGIHSSKNSGTTSTTLKPRNKVWKSDDLVDKLKKIAITHMLHVWNIYLHFPWILAIQLNFPVPWILWLMYIVLVLGFEMLSTGFCWIFSHLGP